MLNIGYAVVILLSFVGSAWSQSINVTVVTCDNPPFVMINDDGMDITGFSIDFFEESVLATYPGTDVNIEFLVVDAIPDVINHFEMLSSPDSEYNETEFQYHVGVGPFTITAAREGVLDFLPAYYASGLSILVRDELSATEYTVAVISDFMMTVGAVIIITIVIIYTLAPIAWFLEHIGSKDAIPMFVDMNTRLAPEPAPFLGYIPISSQFRDTMVEIGNAIRWTGLTLLQVKTGFPKSEGAQNLRGLLTLLALLVLISFNASITLVFNNSGSGSSIQLYTDLNGKAVCTIEGTTADMYMSRNNVGFQTIYTDPSSELEERGISSTQNMFEKFWASKCDAVIYDTPVLESELKTHPESDGRPGVVLPQALTVEFYGFTMSSGNMAKDSLAEGTILAAGDFEFMGGLEEDYLGEIESSDYDAPGDTELLIPLPYILVFSFLGLVTFIVSVTYVYCLGDHHEKTKKYAAIIEAQTDGDYEDEYHALNEQAKHHNEAYHDVTWRIDQQIDPNLTRTLRVVYELNMKVNQLLDWHHIVHDIKDVENEMKDDTNADYDPERGDTLMSFNGHQRVVNRPRANWSGLTSRKTQQKLRQQGKMESILHHRQQTNQSSNENHKVEKNKQMKDIHARKAQMRKELKTRQSMTKVTKHQPPQGLAELGKDTSVEEELTKKTPSKPTLVALRPSNDSNIDPISLPNTVEEE